MLRTPLTLCILTFLFSSFTAYAVSWQCSTHDKANKEWTATSSYQRDALNNAFASCKKESQLPESCNSTRRDCEMLVNGLSTRPLWQCTALDAMALSWKSNIYREAEDAALAAKDYCKDNSALPETCYLYMFMCKNLNPLS